MEDGMGKRNSIPIEGTDALTVTGDFSSPFLFASGGELPIVVMMEEVGIGVHSGRDVAMTT